MRKAKTMTWMKLFLLTMLFFLSLVRIALADVSPGDVIDKSNWQKAQGLLPEQILDWVKKGYMNIKVGMLNYDPKGILSPWIYQSLTTNVGKYDVDKDGELIDQKTGKFPYDLMGIPFPKIDEKDPNAGIKIAYNMRFTRQSHGHVCFDFKIEWISSSGLERRVGAKYYQAHITSNPQTKDFPNPEHLDRQNIFKITDPFDVAGTSVMLWNYQGPKPDQNFAYVPAIRRVRRTSPASRSDALLGSDLTVDDSALYEGKNSNMHWKVLGTQEALVPHVDKDPIIYVLNPDGSYSYLKGPTLAYAKFGYETPGWKGAPWAPTNIIWVKRKVTVVEATPKDPYYNYGTQIFWFDADYQLPYFKIIYDRAKKYWKTAISIHNGAKSEDKKVGWIDEPSSQFTYDERTNHATIIHLIRPDTKMFFWAKNVYLDDFSLVGFQKFCK